MRLFVAVAPPAEVAAAIRNAHVTLRFLGEVDDALVADVAAALVDGLAGERARVATLGTEVRRLGGSALVLPVAGLDELAGAVQRAVGRFGGEDRPFRGHVTLARVRRGRPLPVMAAPAAPLTWTVDAVELVRSELGRGVDGTARHTKVATAPLASGY